MEKSISKLSLLSYIYQNIEVSINDIIEEFHVSISTAYRLARSLREDGWVSIENNKVSYMPFDFFPYEDKATAFTQNALAFKAIDLIEENEVICLSGGSSTIALILPFIIMYKKNIVIISNSTLVFRYYMKLQRIACQKNISLITIGGTIRSHFYSFGGEYADYIIHRFQIEKTFMGTECVDPLKGLYSDILIESFVERNFFDVSEKTYLLAAAVKFKKKCLYQWASWEDFHGFISDYNFQDFPHKDKIDCIKVDPKTIWLGRTPSS